VNADSLPQSQGDRLALLYRVSQTFNSSLDLDTVLNRVMDEVIAITSAERGFVMLRDPSGMLRDHDGNLGFRVARGIDRSMIDHPEFQISRGVVEQVAQEGEPILTSDAQRDERLSMRLSVRGLGLRSILCVPLRSQDQVTGVIYVDNRLQAGIFGRDDLDLLTAVASNAAIAIENARLYQVAVEKGRMERELQMARAVQSSLLPHHTPQMPGWEFEARWQPAREVSGDYYDFIALDGEQLGLVIADVSDKGMPSALFMALTRSTIRATTSQLPSPADGITEANRLICADSAGGMFVTLFYALLDPPSGRLTYVNAGHNPPLLCRAGDHGEAELLDELQPTGMALGVVEDTKFVQRTVHLQPGDFVLLYTDGVTDATGEGLQPYGMDRLRRVILDHQPAPVAGLVAALERSIGDFTGGATQFDDIAILAVKRLGL
jgi:sigma-B regulation protein RsbU (phosphoserine phosphatase)